MDISIVELDPRNQQDLDELEKAWAEIYKKQQTPSLGQEKKYVLANLDWLSPPERRLVFLLVRKKNVPIGILHYEKRREQLGPVVLACHGFISHQAAPTSTGMILDPEFCDVVMGEFIQHLCRFNDKWTIFSLDGLEKNSFVRSCLLKSKNFKQNLLPRPSYPQLYVDLTVSPEQYMKSRTRKHRNNISRARKALARLGVSYEGHSMTPDEGLEKIEAIDSASWRMNKPEDVEKNKALFDYCTRLTRIFPDKSAHCFRFFTHEGEFIAGHYSLLHNGVAYAIKNIFDERFRAHGSPGLLLLHEVLMELFSLDLHRCEFNAKNWYATRLATGHHEISKDMIFNRNARGLLLLYLCRLALFYKNKVRHFRGKRKRG